MRPDLYHTLLYLAAGGNNWQESFSHLPIPWGRPEGTPQEPTPPPGAEPSGPPKTSAGYSGPSKDKVN